MPSFKIAHIKEQGNDLIIIPLESSFGSMSAKDQAAMVADLQAHPTEEKLSGKVVPVWDAGAGRMGFIAPKPWQPFFNSLRLSQVGLSLNKELSWVPALRRSPDKPATPRPQ